MPTPALRGFAANESNKKREFKMRIFLVLSMLLMVAVSGVSAEPILIAEYYETVYWGETKTQERDGFKYVGRDWKTYEITPEKDYKFVIEDESNGDDTDVSLVWTSRDHKTGSVGTALGLCYSYNNNKYAFCGVLVFASEQNLKTWMDEFKGDGENVVDLIETAHMIPAGDYLGELSAQVTESADMVIGNK